MSIYLFMLLQFFGNQAFQNQNLISWTGSYFVVNDSTIQIQVNTKIEDEHYIYGIEKHEDGPIPTSFSSKNGEIKFVNLPKFKSSFDEGFELNINKLKNGGTFDLSLIFSGEFSPEITAEYQICNEENCLPPTTSKITLVKSEKQLFTKKEIKQSDDNISLSDLESKSLWQFILFSISMGFLALLTPCVFPMIPITVSFFTKNAKQTTKEAIGESFFYGFGIVSTFTLIGVLITVAFGATGVQNFAANPWVNIAIALLFVVFAISLFGVFEIQLPSSWVNKVNSAGMKPSKIGTILAGVAFSLVSFTCTVPIVGTLLVATSSGDWMLPLIGMFFFSAAFASPFILLALFPQLLAQMPKSGGWLHATKITLAFVEIAAALKFFSQADLVWNLELITRPVMLASWIALFGIAGFYLLGMVKLSSDDEGETIGIARLSIATVFLVFSIYMITGLSGRPLQADLDSYLPPSDYGQKISMNSSSKNIHAEELDWIENYETALETAKKEKKYLFIDFTGKTCTNCRWMEKNMFVLPEIEAQLKTYTLTRLWTDFGPDKEKNQALEMKLFNTVALPYYAILDTEGNVIKAFDRMTRDKNEFLRFLTL
jgi:thiol:disulfide interchange protein DsbD